MKKLLKRLNCEEARERLSRASLTVAVDDSKFPARNALTHYVLCDACKAVGMARCHCTGTVSSISLRSSMCGAGLSQRNTADM